MSLARGEVPVHEGSADWPSPDDQPAVVIAIAPSMDERLRVARIVSPHAPVLLVASREEALVLLAGRGGRPPPAPTERPVLEPARSAHDPAAAPPGLEVDSEWRTLRWEGASLPLSPLEHDLLVCLLEPPVRTWTFPVLHRTVWGNDHLGGRDDVQSVVKRLRLKLRALSSPVRICAVRGVGLRVVDHRDPVVDTGEPAPEP
jgi:DNA-binding response OmpR family regulator